MYTDGYYSDEDFRTFCSGQDAANIDDFFTDNGEYLMEHLPEVTDREFLAGLRYGNRCDALCQSGYAFDEAEDAPPRHVRARRLSRDAAEPPGE